VELDPVWLLVLPLVFALGWITARYDRGQQRSAGKHASDEVLSAMSALLANDAQAATDKLLSAARLDPDASELHRAVGNLYRRRGLIDRAIEVHEASLRSPALNPADREALILDLGRDYLASGLFDRADGVLRELLTESTNHPVAEQARLLLLEIAQTTRNWAGAINWVKEIQARGGSFTDHAADQLLGHFHCERAEAAITQGDQSIALSALVEAEHYSAPGPAARIKELRARLANSASKPDSVQPSACKTCGFRTKQQLWQCPGCHHWDSFEAIA
jgi:lipopolysaccharide biosynthesis regulator YciM